MLPADEKTLKTYGNGEHSIYIIKKLLEMVIKTSIQETACKEIMAME